MGEKLHPYAYDKPGETVGYMFWCPGCKATHVYSIKLYRPNGNPVWEFNGDLDKPTFKPSLLYQTRREPDKDHVCHLFMTDGKIQFLPDCTHEMKGQTVEIPDWETRNA